MSKFKTLAMPRNRKPEKALPMVICDLSFHAHKYQAGVTKTAL